MSVIGRSGLSALHSDQKRWAAFALVDMITRNPKMKLAEIYRTAFPEAGLDSDDEAKKAARSILDSEEGRKIRALVDNELTLRISGPLEQLVEKTTELVGRIDTSQDVGKGAQQVKNLTTALTRIRAALAAGAGKSGAGMQIMIVQGQQVPIFPKDWEWRDGKFVHIPSMEAAGSGSRCRGTVDGRCLMLYRDEAQKCPKCGFNAEESEVIEEKEDGEIEAEFRQVGGNLRPPPSPSEAESDRIERGLEDAISPPTTGGSGDSGL